MGFWASGERRAEVWGRPAALAVAKDGARTAERRAAIAAIKASGKSPMAFFADLLGNEQAPLELRSKRPLRAS